MKPERNTEKKIFYVSKVKLMSKKRKFRFPRGFMLVLELKGFYSGASNNLDIWMPAMLFLNL